MELTNEERKSIVQIRIEKAKNTFSEIVLLTDNALWQTAANRLYYQDRRVTKCLLLTLT